jgi:hypothetical protein
MAIGSEAEVVAACITHDQLAARYPGKEPPLGKMDEERAAASRWWAADQAAEMAAFVAWKGHPREAWSEVGGQQMARSGWQTLTG